MMDVFYIRSIKQTILTVHFMKRVFGVLMISIMSVTVQAKTFSNDPTSEPKVEIAPKVENNFLSIEVDEELVGTKMTVSVFNSMGEIVLESTLGLGLNKVDVQTLQKGEYVAVVRKNDQYESKSSFVVG